MFSYCSSVSITVCFWNRCTSSPPPPPPPPSFGFVGRPPFVWLKTWAHTEHRSADMRELNSLQMLDDLPMSSFGLHNVSEYVDAVSDKVSIWWKAESSVAYVLHNIISRSSKALFDFLPQSLHKALSLCKCSSSEWSVPSILGLYHIIHKPNLDSHSCGHNTHKCQRTKKSMT